MNMQKVQYRLVARSAFHTGSDEKLGTIRTTKREKVRVNSNKSKVSRFQQTDEGAIAQCKAIALLLVHLYNKMPNKARPTIYSEIADKLLFCANARNKDAFLNGLCKSLEIRDCSMPEKNGVWGAVKILDLFESFELLSCVRKNKQRIMTYFRQIIAEKRLLVNSQKSSEKAAKEEGLDIDIAPISQELAAFFVAIQEEITPFMGSEFIALPIDKVAIEEIPLIPANTIRGFIRRIVMRDFAEIVQLSLPPDTYDMLFTGGRIDASTAYDDIDKRRELVLMCPMLGVLGSAIGSQTVRGALVVGNGELACLERGNSELSHYEQVDLVFGTRLDSKKLENGGILESEKADADPTQMKYEFETVIKGAVFSHYFILDSTNELVISAFWHALTLFRDYCYAGGKKSVGLGEFETVGLTIPEGANELYLAHLDRHKDNIKLFFDAYQGKKDAEKEKAAKTKKK